MIDLHTHLLPNLDDGPGSMEESIFLLNMAKKDGIKKIVLTPHRYKSKDLNAHPEDILNAYNKVGKKVRGIDLYIGSDIALTSDLEERLIPEDPTLFINNSSYFLLELPEDVLPPNILDLLYKIQLKGYIPIITHPERCYYFEEHPEILVPFIDKGILIQLTADAVFDQKTKEFASRVLKHNMVHFVSSDAHSRKRPPILSKAYDHIMQNYGEETAKALFIANPQAVLNDEPIPAFPEAVPFEPNTSILQKSINFLYNKLHSIIFSKEE